MPCNLNNDCEEMRQNNMEINYYSDEINRQSHINEENKLRHQAINNHILLSLSLFQVVVGDYVVGNPEMRRPPPRDESKPHGDLYDSCVDSIRDPSIFVTFERWQSYPEYLLEYS